MKRLVIVLIVLGLLAVCRPAPAADAYSTAHAAAIRNNRPLIVLIDATWCGACKVVERLYLGALRQRGEVVVLDWDRDQAAAVKAAGTGSPLLPTVVIWDRAAGRWKTRRVLVGTGQIQAYIQERKP